MRRSASATGALDVRAWRVVGGWTLLPLLVCVLLVCVLLFAVGEPVFAPRVRTISATSASSPSAPVLASAPAPTTAPEKTSAAGSNAPGAGGSGWVTDPPPDPSPPPALHSRPSSHPDPRPDTAPTPRPEQGRPETGTPSGTPRSGFGTAGGSNTDTPSGQTPDPGNSAGRPAESEPGAPAPAGGPNSPVDGAGAGPPGSSPDGAGAAPPPAGNPGAPPWYDVPAQVATAVTAWLGGLATGATVPMAAVVSGMLDPSRLTTTPSRLRQLWASSRQIADALLVLMILLGGMTVMTYGSVHTRWAAGEILPRLVVGAAAANLSWWLINTGLGLSVGVAVSLAGQGLTPGQVLGGLLVNTAATGGVFAVLLGVVAAVLVVVLALTLIVVTVATTLLIVVAPLALIMHGLPHTEALAYQWWRALGATLAIPTVHGLTLALLARVFLAPGGMSLFGLPGVDQLASTLVLITLLWVLIKTPFWAWSVIKTNAPGRSGGRSGSVLGRLVRTVIAGAALSTLAGATAGAGAVAGAGVARAGAGGGLGGVLGGLARAGGTVGLFGRAGQALHQRLSGPASPRTTTGRPHGGSPAGARRVVRPRPPARVGPATFRAPTSTPGGGGADPTGRPRWPLPYPGRPGPARFTEPTPAGAEAHPARAPRTTASSLAPSFLAPSPDRPHTSSGAQEPAGSAQSVPRTRITAQPPSHRPESALSKGRRGQPRPPASTATATATATAQFSAPPGPTGAGTAGSGRPTSRPAANPAPKPAPRRAPAPVFRSPTDPAGSAGGGRGSTYRTPVPAPVRFSQPTPETAIGYRPRIAHANPFPRLYPDADRTFTPPPPPPHPTTPPPPNSARRSRARRDDPARPATDAGATPPGRRNRTEP